MHQRKKATPVSNLQRRAIRVLVLSLSRSRLTFLARRPSCPLSDYVAAVYAEMRQLEKAQQEISSTYTTPRTLLSILRVAMALAKLRFDRTVGRQDAGWLGNTHVKKTSASAGRGQREGAQVPRVLRSLRNAYSSTPVPKGQGGATLCRCSQDCDFSFFHIHPPHLSCFGAVQVIQSDVDEALRLMRMSKASLSSDAEPQRKEDNVSVCYKWVRGLGGLLGRAAERLILLTREGAGGHIRVPTTPSKSGKRGRTRTRRVRGQGAVAYWLPACLPAHSQFLMAALA